MSTLPEIEPVIQHPVSRYGLAGAGVLSEHRMDTLAQEIPVAIEVNGISHAVMMASPLNLEDFAFGFAYCDGLIDQSSQLVDLEIEYTCSAAIVRLRLDGRSSQHWQQRKRGLAGPTGCGVCGTQSLEQLFGPLPQLPSSQAVGSVHLHEIHNAMATLIASQSLQQQTGAVHAAAWLDLHSGKSVVREDVGRHNALDKVIGALLRSRQPMARGIFVMTSRASFELIQKTLRAAVPLLAVVSAPTALAVNTAQNHGLTLVGFMRDQRLTVYTHPQRLTGSKH